MTGTEGPAGREEASASPRGSPPDEESAGAPGRGVAGAPDSGSADAPSSGGADAPDEASPSPGTALAGPAPGRISPAQLERVIRRAADLQMGAGEGEGAGELDEAEVVRIGEEVGLDPRHVRQALAEVRAESLLPDMPEGPEIATRVWGPGLVRESRVVPGGRGEVEAKLDRHFREVELLKRVRSRPGRSLWEAAGGLVSTMQRAMDVGGRGYELAKARSVELSVEPLEPGRCLVTLTADLRNARGQAAAASYTVGSLVGAAGAIFLVAAGGPELPLLLGSAAAGAPALGGATWATHAYVKKRLGRVRLVLQGILDRLEQGVDPAPAREGWREKLLG